MALLYEGNWYGLNKMSNLDAVTKFIRQYLLRFMVKRKNEKNKTKRFIITIKINIF
jgi:hypothetical protein